jgi:anoctamin-1
MTDYVTEIEPPRPEYVNKVKKFNNKKRNFITGEEEFVPQTWKIFRTLFISYSTVLFFVSIYSSSFFMYNTLINSQISLSIVAIIAIEIMQAVSKSGLFHSLNFFAIFAPGLISLTIIIVLDTVYNFVAQWLTDREFHRTQTDYDDSLALKIYLFQFVNNYSSLFYLAFVQAYIVGFPGHYNMIEISSQKYRQEECQNGCFMELSIQLVIIMVGKQILGALNEMMPFFLDFCKNQWKAKQSGLNESPKQWVREYYLTPVPETGLFSEYLEMGES